MTADPRIPWNYTLPNNNLARTMEECITSLAKQGINWTVSGTGVDEGGLWCNATWDTVLCWPPIPANTSITLPCPAMKGLDPKKNVTKACAAGGYWLGKPGEPLFSRGPGGWTDYSMCFTEELYYIYTNLNSESLAIAQEVAQKARNIEFVGLGLSLISLTISIFIITYFRRLRVFRNLMHLHLMIAILMVTIIRLIIYIDLIVGGNYGGPHSNSNDGKTINTMPIVCEMMYLLLEYFKTVSFMWMFLEGFNLHNLVVLSVFNADPQLMPYVIVGYGVPCLNVIIWLLFMLWRKGWKIERCLGPYYLEAEFWILNGPRMVEWFLSFFFIFNIIRVLWTKVSEPHQAGDQDRIWKSVKAALMLCFLLGLPNIMQTILFAPTRDNIMVYYSPCFLKLSDLFRFSRDGHILHHSPICTRVYS
ncbi:hypothetical protein WR25_14732 [Diploscapter pachys]|uniref:G-protein coupled receptors family 2 profile 2 domain-containing protein n=1 Tax=Diploscapter pachys TaxID=2018661 RepID=A0A2A2J9B4_9BILA|nr:hypothetical protein WR25_14732 [Diploscapter pachys]